VIEVPRGSSQFVHVETAPYHTDEVKVKLSLCVRQEHVWDWRYSSTYSELRHYLEENAERDVTVVLLR